MGIKSSLTRGKLGRALTMASLAVSTAVASAQTTNVGQALSTNLNTQGSPILKLSVHLIGGGLVLVGLISGAVVLNGSEDATGKTWKIIAAGATMAIGAWFLLGDPIGALGLSTMFSAT